VRSTPSFSFSLSPPPSLCKLSSQCRKPYLLQSTSQRFTRSSGTLRTSSHRCPRSQLYSTSSSHPNPLQSNSTPFSIQTTWNSILTLTLNLPYLLSRQDNQVSNHLLLHLTLPYQHPHPTIPLLTPSYLISYQTLITLTGNGDV
jgi:hypothetical protein